MATRFLAVFLCPKKGNGMKEVKEIKEIKEDFFDFYHSFKLDLPMFYKNAGVWA